MTTRMVRGRAFWCLVGGAAVVGMTAVGSVLGTIPVANRPAASVLLVGGVLFGGLGWSWLRRLKRAEPGVSWLAFLRRELILVGVLVAVGLGVAALPQDTRDDIRDGLEEVVKEVANAIQMLEAGRGRP